VGDKLPGSSGKVETKKAPGGARFVYRLKGDKVKAVGVASGNPKRALRLAR
jgi:hypothetical protein